MQMRLFEQNKYLFLLCALTKIDQRSNLRVFILMFLFYWNKNKHELERLSKREEEKKKKLQKNKEKLNKIVKDLIAGITPCCSSFFFPLDTKINK